MAKLAMAQLAMRGSSAQSPSTPLALFANCVHPVRGAVT